MNGLNELLQHPITEQLARTLLHSLWQLALIGLAAWCVLRLMRRRSANARYALACAALTLMLAAPLLTLGYLRAGSAPPTPAFSEAPAKPHVPPPAPTTETAFVTTADQADAAAPPTEFRSDRPAVLPYLTALWGVGVLIGSLRLIGGWAMVQRLRVVGTRPMPDDWPRRIDRLASAMGMRGRVRVLASSKAALPVALGVWRPLVLIPVAVINGLSPAQVESIITHELAHIRRHDYLVNLLQCAAETLLFYHPAVWWVGRAIRQEREHCCDDRVVALSGNRANYALALTRLAELIQRQPPIAPAATGGALSQRVRRIIHGDRAPDRRRAERLLLAGLAPVLLTLSLIVYGAGAEPRAADPPEAVEPETPHAGPAEPDAPAPKPAFTQRVIEVPKDKLLAGDASVNLVIRPGDVIRISKADGYVFLGGKIKRPGTYALSGNRPLTVKQLITTAGGIDPKADGVIVIRRTGHAEQLVFAATDHELRQIGGADLELKPHDLVKVVAGIRDLAKGERAKELRDEIDTGSAAAQQLREREAGLIIALAEARQEYAEAHKTIVDIKNRLEVAKAQRAKLEARRAEIWDALMREVRKRVVKPKPEVVTSAIRPEDLKPTTGPYRLAPGDVVNVSVHGLVNPGVEHAQTRRVDETGRIRLTKIGELEVAGLTARKLEQEVVKALHPDTLRNPQVGVTVKEARGNTFSVIGDSKDVRTGVYTLTRPNMRVLEAIALVGGVSQDTRVFVIRQNTTPTTDQVKVRAIIERDGKVISSPTITTRPGAPASIEIKKQANPGDGVRVEVTPERSAAPAPSADPTQSHAVIGRVLGKAIRLSDLGLDADHVRELKHKVWDDASRDPLEPYLRLRARKALRDAMILQHAEMNLTEAQRLRLAEVLERYAATLPPGDPGMADKVERERARLLTARFGAQLREQLGDLDPRAYHKRVTTRADELLAQHADRHTPLDTMVRNAARVLAQQGAAQAGS